MRNMKGRLIIFLLVTFVMLFCSCENNNKTQEYTLHYSGEYIGIITIKKDFFKKITITPKMSKFHFNNIRYGEIFLDNKICSLLPKNKYYIDIFTKNITINGNTTIQKYSNGDWEKTVVEGDTMTVTSSNGYWWKTVVDGNTTTLTTTDGYWRKKVVDKRGYNIYIFEENGGDPEPWFNNLFK